MTQQICVVTAAASCFEPYLNPSLDFGAFTITTNGCKPFCVQSQERFRQQTHFSSAVTLLLSLSHSFQSPWDSLKESALSPAEQKRKMLLTTPVLTYLPCLQIEVSVFVCACVLCMGMSMWLSAYLKIENESLLWGMSPRVNVQVGKLTRKIIQSSTAGKVS